MHIFARVYVVPVKAHVGFDRYAYIYIYGFLATRIDVHLILHIYAY